MLSHKTTHKTIEDLFERLRKKLGNLRKDTLRRRLQRKAAELGINTTEAIFVLAKENKIGYLNSLKRLLPETQSKISDVIRSSANFYIQHKPDKKSKIVTKVIILKTKFGVIREPFLAENVKKELKLMSENTYPSFYIFENSLRNFIQIVMEKKYNQEWWNQQMKTKKLKEIANKVEGRMDIEERLAWHGKRGAHPIFYSDFNDLPQIIKTHQVVFKPYFQNQKAKVDWLLLKIYEVEPSRNVTAHHNPLSDRDLTRVSGNLADWLSQLGYLKSQNLL